MKVSLDCLQSCNISRKTQQPIKSSKNKTTAVSENICCLELVGDLDQRLACLGSNQVVSVFDQSNLKLSTEINSLKNTNSIGLFKKNSQMLFACGNDGQMQCWDMRARNKIALEIEVSGRDLLCADSNSCDELLAVGTNKNVDDALVLIFDHRNPSKPLHSLKESHSSDISQVKFNPQVAKQFTSAGLDGLVCFYDLGMPEQANSPKPVAESDSDSSDSDSESDPDFMEQCLNTDSCVDKIGYLASKGSIDRLFATTTTNDFFLWDLASFDTIFEKKSSKVSESEQDEDIFFDCFYLSDQADEHTPFICQSSKDGLIKLTNKGQLSFQQDKNDKKFHRDAVRSSFWNPTSRCLFTADDEGFIFKWKISQAKSENATKKRKNEDFSDADSKTSKKFLTNKD